MPLTEIKTSGIADDAVTTDKLANAINTERTANTAKPTLANDANNRVVTGTGSGLNGEANLTFDGTHLTISDGDLIIGTDAHGINFAASEGGTNTSSEASLLNDYEEGTWTPGLTVGTASHSGNKYIKVGKVVHFWGRFWHPTDVSSSDSVEITGLPFPVAVSGAAGSVFGKDVNTTAGTVVYVDTAEHIFLYGSNAGNFWTTVKYNDLVSSDNTEIFYCGSYYTT